MPERKGAMGKTTSGKVKLPPMQIGWRERIALPELGIDLMQAKIDTGARTSALHATRAVRFQRDGADWVRFHIPHASGLAGLDCEAPLVDRREIKKFRNNPCDRDTDDGGASDGKEIAAGSDPLDPSSTPKNPRGTAARGVTG